MSTLPRTEAELAAEQRRGIAMVLLAATLWSTSGLFVKLLTVSPLELTGLRSALATLSLLPFVRLRSLRVDLPMVVLALGFGFTQLFFITATRWTTAANAIALQSTAPAWVFLLSSLSSRRVQVPLLLPLLLICAGIAAMLAEPVHGTSLYGNLLALGCGFTFGVTQVAFKRVNQPAVGAVALANLASAIVIPVLAPAAFRLGEIAPWEWVALVYLGAIQIGLANLCFMSGVRRITVSQASILVLLEPLLNPLWVFWVLGEAPSAYGLAGFVLILAGIAVDFWLRLTLPSLQHPPAGP